MCGCAFLTLSFQMRCPVLILAPWPPVPPLIASSDFTALVPVLEPPIENIWQAHVEFRFLCFMLGTEELMLGSHKSQP